MSFTSLGRILIIRLSSLGDIILSEPVVRALRSAYPNAHLAFLTRAPFVDILRGFNGLDEIIPFQPKDKSSHLRSLERHPWDAVVDLQNNLRSRMLLAKLSFKRLARYHRPRLARWLRINLKSLTGQALRFESVIIGYLKAASPLGAADDGVGLQLSVPAEWRIEADDCLKLYGLELNSLNQAVIIAPGARHFTKRWISSGWAELLDEAYRRGFAPLLIIGDGGDIPIARAIVQITDAPVIDLTGKTTLGGLTALIQSAAVMVTNDSAPMHIAAGVGTPVVALFGATVPEFGFAPQRCRFEIVQVEGLPCRPCHPHGTAKCPRGHFKCMKDIPASEVINAVIRVSDFEVDLLTPKSGIIPANHRPLPRGSDEV